MYKCIVNMNQQEFEKKVIEVIPFCNSLNDLCSRFGFKGVKGYYDKMNKVIKKYNLDISHFGKLTNSNKNEKMTNDEYFIKNSNRNGKRTLFRLIHDFNWERKCQECGRTEWEGHPIPLEVHHKNGDHYDNRLENLEIICRNCHYYTDSFCRHKNSNIITKEDYCIECGNPINGTNGVKFCSQNCFHIYEQKHIENYEESLNKARVESSNKRRKNFSKNEIILALKESRSFLGAGKILNVSDNTIRKYCKEYDIPVKSKEMKNYLDII